ncbi:MAG: hypothetical protein ACLS9K_01580 [Lachnospira eligens]
MKHTTGIDIVVSGRMMLSTDGITDYVCNGFLYLVDVVCIERRKIIMINFGNTEVPAKS